MNQPGQLILKCLFVLSKTNENKSTWGTIVVKLNLLFVRFLEEFTAWKFAFEFYWLLELQIERRLLLWYEMTKFSFSLWECYHTVILEYFNIKE